VTKRSKSSGRWLERQRRDRYVAQAAQQGLGSRAHFKLKQLDERFKLIAKDAVVVELGAAPGGWTRYLATHAARVIAIDILPMPNIAPNVTVLALDVYSRDFDAQLASWLGVRKASLVLSDMAPNISGIRAADQAATMDLVDLATAVAHRHLNRGGHLVVKMFQGEGVDAWLAARRKEFDRVVLAKPDASRAQSREVYGVAMGFSGKADPCLAAESEV